MSIRVDLSPLIAGSVVVGDPGLGVLGSLIPATGEHGPGYAYDDLIAGDDTKEIRGLIVTPPTNGTLTAFEDTSFEYDGTSDTFSYQLYVDGVARGSVVTHTINIGSVPVTEPTTFWVVYPASETAPTGAQIVSGLAWGPAVAAGNDTARVDTGSQSFPEVTGLAPGDYRAAFVVYDGSEYSNVDVSAVETVAASTITLTATDATSTPTATTGALAQTHSLTATDATSTPTATTGALAQTHSLTATDATSTPTATTGAISTEAAIQLVVDNVVSTPTATTGTVGQTHSLAAANATSNAETTSAVLDVEGAISLSAVSATSAAATTTSAVTQVHSISLGDIEVQPINTTGSITINAATLLLASDASSIPELPSTAITQTQVLSALNIVSSPSLTSSAIGISGTVLRVRIPLSRVIRESSMPQSNISTERLHRIY